MQDDSHSSANASLVNGEAEVRRTAQHALAVLKAHGPGRSDSPARRLEQLCDAFVSPDANRRHDMLMQLRQDGVQINDIIDHVLPAVARIMGERWASDQMSFAQVAIGAGCLQEAVRALGWHDKTRRPVAETAPVILLIVPRPEHHTLGTFVLADQWRRMGFQVDIAIDEHPRQVAEMLRKRRYVLIGITAAGRRSLVSAREFVDSIRAVSARATPIFIGGAILDHDLDVIAITGADHTARDVASALQACGLVDAGWEAPSQTMNDHAGPRHDRQ